MLVFRDLALAMIIKRFAYCWKRLRSVRVAPPNNSFIYSANYIYKNKIKNEYNTGHH